MLSVAVLESTDLFLLGQKHTPWNPVIEEGMGQIRTSLK